MAFSHWTLYNGFPLHLVQNPNSLPLPTAREHKEEYWRPISLRIYSTKIDGSEYYPTWLKSQTSYQPWFSHFLPEDFYFFVINLIFNWRVVPLQNVAVFCQTSTWISHRYTCIPPFRTSLPSPPVDNEPLVEFPESHRKFLLAICFTYGHVSSHDTLSTHLTLSACPYV